MRKIAIFIFLAAILSLLSFTSYGDSVYQFLGNRYGNSNYSQLKFTSLKGEYKIFLNEKQLGVIKDGETNDFLKIRPGLNEVKIERVSEPKDFYFTLVRQLKFIPAAEVEIIWEAGPTLESSSGTIKYFTQIAKNDGAEVYVSPFPNNAEVEFDGRKSEANTFSVGDTRDHTISVSYGEGFEQQNIKVNLTNEFTKKVLTNLRLVVEATLYKEPFINS